MKFCNEMHKEEATHDKIGQGSNQSQLQILRRGGVFVTASRTALSDLIFPAPPFYCLSIIRTLAISLLSLEAIV